MSSKQNFKRMTTFRIFNDSTSCTPSHPTPKPLLPSAVISCEFLFVTVLGTCSERRLILGLILASAAVGVEGDRSSRSCDISDP